MSTSIIKYIIPLFFLIPFFLEAQENELEDKVISNAEIIKNHIKQRYTELIEQAVVEYEDTKIEADYIVIEWDSGNIFARGETDSTGKIISDINFYQAGKLYNYKQANFNFKTKEGIASNVTTIEDEMFIISEKLKKVNDFVYLGRRNKITTDPYVKARKDTIPDYYIGIGKMKLIRDKGAVTGPIYMSVEGVPLPIALPFAYLPISGEKRSAGILIGSFGERESMGFYLDRWGFYVPFGDVADMENRFTFYTKGSWSINSDIRYYNRYRYSGMFSFTYDKKIEGTAGLDDYVNSSLYNFQWTHSTDSKSNPTLNLTANVNFMSSDYYRQSINNSNYFNGNYIQSSANSSLSLTKRFRNSPISASLNMNSSQDLKSGLLTMNLPTLNVSVSRQYPFASKNKPKKTIFQKIYLDYTNNIINSLVADNDDLFTAKMFDSTKTYMTNRFKLGTGTTLFNYFQFNISGSYNEVWTLNSVRKEYDPSTSSVLTHEVNQFKTFRTFSASANIETTLYGTKIFKKGALIQGIRHMMTPSVGVSYIPNFSEDKWGYFGHFYDKNGVFRKYSYFEGVSSINSMESKLLTLGLSNNLEMKVRNKKDSVSGTKKLKIFESLNINTFYNMALDSLKWGDISVSGRTSFFNSRLSATYNMNINPYKIVYDSKEAKTGYKIDKYGYFSILNYNISASLRLDQSIFKKNDFKQYRKKGRIRYENFYFDEDNYAHFDIPWSLNLGLSYSSSKGYNRKYETSASVNISGNIKPSPFWDINFSTNYDIENKGFGYTTLSFARDLRSFTINFSWNPSVKTWNFYFGIKANVFKDAINFKKQSSNSTSSQW